jgi:hypothetical protein
MAARKHAKRMDVMRDKFSLQRSNVTPHESNQSLGHSHATKGGALPQGK